MIYYKSQWFCQSDCTNSDCQRHVNTRVLEAADEAGQKIKYMVIKTSACPWYKKPKLSRKNVFKANKELTDIEVSE